MPAKKPARSYPAARKFALRSDASAASGQREIERVFKLPAGNVRLEPVGLAYLWPVTG